MLDLLLNFQCVVLMSMVMVFSFILEVLPSLIPDIDFVYSGSDKSRGIINSLIISIVYFGFSNVIMSSANKTILLLPCNSYLFVFIFASLHWL